MFNEYMFRAFLKYLSCYIFLRFRRAMLCISAAIADMRCLSVRLSVTFVSCAKTNKDIFEFFSPSGSQAILVFRLHVVQ